MLYKLFFFILLRNQFKLFVITDEPGAMPLQDIYFLQMKRELKKYRKASLDEERRARREMKPCVCLGF
jgi:hypothetical protein